MIVSVRNVLSEGAACLHAAGIESARIDARLLLAVSLGVSSDVVFAQEEVGPKQRGEFQTLIARRAAREPLAYIVGTKEFWSLPFAVGPDVLIPRPETETLVETALQVFGDTDASLCVLDIGTGSGCLLISFLVQRANARGVGIDSSRAALAWARKNALRHGVEERCRFECSEWEPARETSFDVILANPPYLTATEFDRCNPEIRKHEPRSALVAGDDGLESLRALAPVLYRRIAPDGRAFVEIGAGQARAATQILIRCGLDVFRTVPDLSGIPRCLIVGRLETGEPSAPKKSVGNELPTG